MCVDRSACRKGCIGPVLRPIQRFGRVGKRSGPEAPKNQAGQLKNYKYMYLSLDEAGTHVGGGRFRLIFCVYDESGSTMLGTTVSTPIRVLANNDVPTGAAHVPVHITLRCVGWEVGCFVWCCCSWGCNVLEKVAGGVAQGLLVYAQLCVVSPPHSQPTTTPRSDWVGWYYPTLMRHLSNPAHLIMARDDAEGDLNLHNGPFGPRYVPNPEPLDDSDLDDEDDDDGDDDGDDHLPGEHGCGSHRHGVRHGGHQVQQQLMPFNSLPAV